MLDDGQSSKGGDSRPSGLSLALSFCPSPTTGLRVEEVSCNGDCGWECMDTGSVSYSSLLGKISCF